MSSSILDILINEVANVLGITPDEVKKQFTKEQLDELLNSSLCEPMDDSGIPIESLGELPCDDLAVPKLLPQVPNTDLENLQLEIQNSINLLSLAQDQIPGSQGQLITTQQSLDPNVTGLTDRTGTRKTPIGLSADQPKQNSLKCIDKIEEVNKEIEDQLDQYLEHKILLEKLIEYRDNYKPLSLYYLERSKEAARIFGEFSPILTEIKRINVDTERLNAEREVVLTKIAAVNAADIPSEDKSTQFGTLNKSLVQITNDLSANIIELSKNESLLKDKEKSFPIFNDSSYESIVEYIEDPDKSSVLLPVYLLNLTSKYIDSSSLNQINEEFKKYSECLSIDVENNFATSISQVTQNSFINFKLKFIQLNFIDIEKEIVDKASGEKKTIIRKAPIRQSTIIKKNSFFKNTSLFQLSEFTLSKDQEPQGTIYTKYYNLFKDPINKLFSLDERGLTDNLTLVDPKVKGTSADRKREAGAEHYIKDLDVMSKFYEDFEARLENKKNELRKKAIDPQQDVIKLIMQKVARKEMQFILAVGGVSKSLIDDSNSLKSVQTSLTRQNDEFIASLAELDEEIIRVQNKVEELKPTPDKIKNLLKKKSPDCFDRIDEKPQGCADTKSKLGIDPLFLKTLNGTDPTLPNHNQLCYWLEFSKIINLIGLLPLPNVPNFTQLRYWPVGFIIPYPGGFIKIPLPVIWLPLLVISLPLGNIVIFLTINGIFISPVVFFVSSTGFKQHILTLRGSSSKFGYTSEDESIKASIYPPVALLAAAAKAERLAKIAKYGKDYLLDANQRRQFAQQVAILAANETAALASKNVNRLLRVAREKKNLLASVAGLSDLEKLENALNKTDSVKDIIDDAKYAIFQRIDELGKPSLGNSNLLKSKINARQERLVNELKEALLNGDLEEADRIREKLKSDGIPLTDKIEAIKADLLAYFDKIKLPKITIPKDASKIDPKQNVIIEFIQQIMDFTNIYKSQFFSLENTKVKQILLIQLAKNKGKLKELSAKYSDAAGRLDIEKDSEKVKKYLLDINKSLIDSALGNGATGDIGELQKKIDETAAKVAKEKDPIKRQKLRKTIEKQRILRADIFENTKVKEGLAITPEVMLALSQLSVNFNPFTSCCNQKKFSLDLSINPAIPIFNSVLALLNSMVSGLSIQDLKALFGGRSIISPNEIISSYISLLKKNIPDDVAIPLPSINIITFAKAFAGLFISLFELKAPNLSLQPALPAQITIDLNVLKKPLLILLLDFLKNCLPDATETTVTTIGSTTNTTTIPGSSGSTSLSGNISTASATTTNAAYILTNANSSSSLSTTGTTTASLVNGQVVQTDITVSQSQLTSDRQLSFSETSDSIKIINCETDTSNNSILSSGIYEGNTHLSNGTGQNSSTQVINDPVQIINADGTTTTFDNPLNQVVVLQTVNVDINQIESDTLKLNGSGALIKSTSSNYSSGNVIVSSHKDILTAFQNLDVNFINLNPGDLLSVVKNFIDLKFDEVETVLDPFYTIVKTIQAAKGTNLNILESAQYTIPPYGPAAGIVHAAITKAKQFAPKSASYKLINLDLVKAKTAILEASLGPIANSPIPPLLAAGAGALDSILPKLKFPEIDPRVGSFSTKDKKVATLLLRNAHPLLSQDDIPPWERLSSKNILFLLFADEFLATGADQVGFFRAFI